MKSTLVFLCVVFCCSTRLMQAQQSLFATSKDGARICYRVFGQGEPLLIINGGPGMHSAGFESLAKRLARKYQTIIYDQRGTGNSIIEKADSEHVTMQRMIDDIESIRKQMNLPSWSVMGQSFGGMLACYYATQYPDRIKRMVLSASGGIDLDLLTYIRQSIDSKLSHQQRDSVRYWTKKIDEGDTSHHARYRRGLHLASAYVINKKYIPVIAERLTQGNALINQLIWDDMHRIHFDCGEGLKKFKRPVLIIQGRQDIISKSTAEKARRVLSRATLVMMDHCSHYGWLDAEQLYFKSIDALMACKP